MEIRKGGGASSRFLIYWTQWSVDLKWMMEHRCYVHPLVILFLICGYHTNIPADFPQYSSNNSTTTTLRPTPSPHSHHYAFYNLTSSKRLCKIFWKLSNSFVLYLADPHIPAIIEAEWYGWSLQKNQISPQKVFQIREAQPYQYCVFFSTAGALVVITV